MHWRLIATRLFWPSLLSSLSITFMQVAITFVAEQPNSRDIGLQLGVFAAVVVGFCFVFFGQWLLVLASVTAVRQILKIDDDAKESARYTSRRKWAILLIYLICHILPAACGFGFVMMLLLCILFQFLGPVGVVISIFYGLAVFLVFLVTVCIAYLCSANLFALIAIEDFKLNKVLSRGFELTFAAPWKGVLFVLLLYTVITAFAWTFSLPLIPIELYESAAGAHAARMPVYVRVLEAAFATLSSIVSFGIIVTSCAIFYRDTIIRREGVDLLEQLDAIERPDRLIGSS